MFGIATDRVSLCGVAAVLSHLLTIFVIECAKLGDAFRNIGGEVVGCSFNNVAVVPMANSTRTGPTINTLK